MYIFVSGLNQIFLLPLWPDLFLCSHTGKIKFGSDVLCKVVDKHSWQNFYVFFLGWLVRCITRQSIIIPEKYIEYATIVWLAYLTEMWLLCRKSCTQCTKWLRCWLPSATFEQYFALELYQNKGLALFGWIQKVMPATWTSTSVCKQS